MTVHDLDARRDLVFAMLGRRTGRASSRGRSARPAGGGRGVRPRRRRPRPRARRAGRRAGRAAGHRGRARAFPAEGPGAASSTGCATARGVSRLLEEVAAAGIEQVILVSAVPPRGKRTSCSAGRADCGGGRRAPLGVRDGRLRDVLEHFDRAFARCSSIRPPHNPLTPLDFAGVYDERSDRRTRWPNWWTAATRMPTGSSSSRSSAPAANRPSRWRGWSRRHAVPSG
jgi:hypothetical protein